MAPQLVSKPIILAEEYAGDKLTKLRLLHLFFFPLVRGYWFSDFLVTYFNFQTFCGRHWKFEIIIGFFFWSTLYRGGSVGKTETNYGIHGTSLTLLWLSSEYSRVHFDNFLLALFSLSDSLFLRTTISSTRCSVPLIMVKFSSHEMCFMIPNCLQFFF